jgi:hypothetical protein
MDSLHRSKHLWCLKRCKEASIDRSQDSKEGFASIYACIFLSTKGAYYGANYP